MLFVQIYFHGYPQLKKDFAKHLFYQLALHWVKKVHYSNIFYKLITIIPNYNMYKPLGLWLAQFPPCQKFPITVHAVGSSISKCQLLNTQEFKLHIGKGQISLNCSQISCQWLLWLLLEGTTTGQFHLIICNCNHTKSWLVCKWLTFLYFKET